jgi:ABC-2 type transport system ATP-binding protein
VNAIETRALRKVYRDVTAVDGLDLTVAEGELFALLGVNGAGKTTTIKMLTCLTPPTAGDALICGKSVTRETSAVKQLVGVSPQETAVAANLTVRENLHLMAELYGADRASAARDTAEILVQLGLESVAEKRAKTLSGGWQRRLSIAMALISKPRVLFLDEPTLGLDVIARRELWSVIERLKGETTVILTTHYLEEAESLADRIGIMVHGSLRAVGTAVELRAQTGTDSLENAFLALVQEGGEAV